MVRILMTLDDRSGGQAFRLIYFEHHLETEFPQCRRERNNMNNGCGLVEHVLRRHHDRGLSETRFSAGGHSEGEGSDITSGV
jgi:hypothetical protein